MSTTFSTTNAVPASSVGNTYTLLELSSAVEFAAGGTLDSRMTAADVVNDALEWLCKHHAWTWLRKEMSLDFTNGQSFVNLPADFKAIQNIVRNSQTEALVPVSLEDLHILRAAGTLGATFNTHYALGYTTQATTSTNGTYRLEIYPTPTADVEAAIIGTYLRRVPPLTSASALPDIPAPWHPPLRWLCRAFAKSDQNESGLDGPDFERAMGMLEDLKNQVNQPGLGMMQGAVGVMRSVDRRYLPGTVVSPS